MPQPLYWLLGLLGATWTSGPGPWLVMHTLSDPREAKLWSGRTACTCWAATMLCCAVLCCVCVPACSSSPPMATHTLWWLWMTLLTCFTGQTSLTCSGCSHLTCHQAVGYCRVVSPCVPPAYACTRPCQRNPLEATTGATVHMALGFRMTPMVRHRADHGLAFP